MKKILSQQYDLLESKSFRHIFVFGGMTFGFIFLWLFEPYGLYNLSSVIEKIKVIGLYIGCGLILMVLQFYILQDFVIKYYTVLNTILWILISIILIGLSATLINDILFNDSVFTFKRFVYFQGVILSINVIPVSLFVLIHYNWTLNKRLRKASQVNSKLKSASCEFNDKRKVIINSDNKNERIKIPLKSLLFITTLDNYIELYIFDDGELSKKTIT